MGWKIAMDDEIKRRKETALVCCKVLPGATEQNLERTSLMTAITRMRFKLVTSPIKV
jgi:hypothetical protein